MNSLAITSSCIVSPLGIGKAATFAALQDGTGGLVPCSFDTADIPTWVGEVAGVENFALDSSLVHFECRNNRLAAMALATDGFISAVDAARDRYGADRIGVFLGTSTSGILDTEIAYRNRNSANGALPADFRYAETQNTYSVADFVTSALGLSGPALVVSSACASTTKAFGNAARAIEAGLCDAAVVGGADSLCLTTLYGFHSLMLTSETPCRPFAIDRDGISIGEGAGFVLLEKLSRGTSGHPLLFGVGESSDAYHMSSPHPEGLGAKLAMERSLLSASLKAEDIGYINLHGTATRVGDAAEDKAVCNLFGHDTPCSSIKGYTGHTLGASGIVEAVISLLCLEHGFMPGSPQTGTIDPALHCHYLLDSRQTSLRYIMSNSFGFGGSNCSLVLGRAA